MPFSVDLPDPPVPADCDLRALPYYPLNYQRLFGSSFHRLATGDEWKAGLCLWANSWHEIPAGSLPTDDRELCVLAELGRDMRAWRKVKEMALHGWVPHSDGRLYHPVVTEVTLTAVGKVVANRHRTQAALVARQAKQRNVGRNVGRHTQRNVHQIEVEGKELSDRKEPNGSSLSDSSDPNGSGAVAPETRTNVEVFDPVKDLWDRGLAIVGAKHRALLGKMVKAHGQPAVLGAIVECEREQPVDPAAYFVRCCEQRRNGGGTPAANFLEGAWRLCNELDALDQQAGDLGASHNPAYPLLDRK